MLSSFNQCCVIAGNNFYYLKEVNSQDNRKCLQNIKKHQIIFVRFVQAPFNWKCCTSYSSSLILKITICSAFTKIPNAKYNSYFHKKNYGSLCKLNWSIKDISILWLINKSLVEKNLAYTEHILTSNKRNDKCFNNCAYSLFFLMAIFLKHLRLIPNILKWQDCKIFTKLVPL